MDDGKVQDGKMKAFLDIFLFDIARRQNKWLGGLENIDDQRGLIDNVVDKSDIKDILEEGEGGNSSVLERMIAIYERQDLNSIDSMYNHNNNGEGDPVLERRNRNMAARMDSLASVRSMVYAVGVAHLPGEQGLIRLLQKRGFTVEPVMSANKIKAGDYKVPEMPVVWNEVKDEQGWYEASMPGKPGDVRLYGILDMKMYVDLFNGTGYFTTAARSVYSKEKMDSLMDGAAAKMFSKEKKDYRLVTVGVSTGRLYDIHDNDGFKKGYILSKGNVIYIAMGTSEKKDSSNLSNIDHFLASFKPMDLVVPDSSNNYHFVDSALAYEVEIPNKPTVYEAPGGSKKVAGEWNSKVYISVDPQEGVYYFFGANSARQGRFIENDSIFFNNLRHGALQNLSKVNLDTTYYLNDHRVFELQGKSNKADVLTITRYIPRGNRWYALVVVYPMTTGPTAIVSRFLRSFTMLDYPAYDWQKAGTPDTLFTTWSPSPFTREARDSSDPASVEYKYTSFDSSRSNSYAVVSYHLSPYYWSLSDSAFWKQRVDGHVSFKDSVVYKKPVSNGDAKGWELMKIGKNARMYQRQRVLLNGNTLYSLYACVPLDEVNSPNADRFFEDFRFSGPPAKTDVFEPKPGKLINDLFSGDSAVAAASLDYLGEAPFVKADLGLLHQALLRKATLQKKGIDPERMSNRIRQRIVSLKDSSSFVFAAENYKRVPDSDRLIKDNLLIILASYPTEAHFAEMADLLAASPPANVLPYSFLQNLKDTLRLTAEVMPKLLPLLADSLVRPSVTNLAATLLDSNLLTGKDIMPFQAAILRYAASRTRSLSGNPKDYTTNDLALIKVLGHLNNPISNASLRRFGAIRENYLKIKVIDALLRNKQQIDSKELLSIAADKSNRLPLYRVLEKTGSLSLFPQIYHTQKLFGESEVYEDIVDGDDNNPPSAIVFVATKLFETKNGRKRFFFYKVSQRTGPDGEPSVNLACVGPYDLDLQRAEPLKTLAKFDFDEPFDINHAEDQMHKLLLEME